MKESRVETHASDKPGRDDQNDRKSMTYRWFLPVPPRRPHESLTSLGSV
jgi:hypothetical protein